MIRIPDALRAAMIAAFPPRPITKVMINEPSGRWWNYEKRNELEPELAGRMWTELDGQFIETHATALCCAGDETFGALLPAYLAYLLEHDAYNEVPFHVARQLTFDGDDPVDTRIFQARIALLGSEQRVVIARVMEQLSMRPPMESVMTAALETWKNLPGGEASTSSNH